MDFFIHHRFKSIEILRVISPSIPLKFCRLDYNVGYGFMNGGTVHTVDDLLGFDLLMPLFY